MVSRENMFTCYHRFPVGEFIRLCFWNQSLPLVGLEVTNREIKTWAEIQSLILNPLSHPGAPNQIILILNKLNMFVYPFLYL